MTSERKNNVREAFKREFKLSKGLKGNTFDKTYIKKLAKTDKGLEEIKNIYSKILSPVAYKKGFEKKVMSYLEGKSLAEALNYNSESQKTFIEELEAFVKSGTDEARDIFLIVGLGFKPDEIMTFDFKDKDIKPTSQPTIQKEIMEGVQRTKTKLADPVQEKGERPITKKEKEEIKKSMVDAELATIIKEKKEIEGIELDKEQIQVIREQLEADTKKKIEESGKKAIKRKAEQVAKEAIEGGLKKMESPTVSPEEMPTAKEQMEQEKKAQQEAKAERPTTGMTDKEEEDLLGISQENVKMEVKQPKRKPDPTDIEPLPSKSDFIPPMRLGTRGKDIKDLLSDINYFFKNFKSQLKREQEFFKNVDKSNIDQLRELHNRIVGKLAPPKKKEEGKKIGIIVNADEYIREQMKKILQEQTFSSLRPQDVVIDVGSREAEGRERDTKDFGDFAVKRSVDGGLAATREAVYRYMPSENDPEIGEEGKSEKQRKKANRLSLPKARLNNQRSNAIRMNVNNPFRVQQKTIKLKYLY